MVQPVFQTACRSAAPACDRTPPFGARVLAIAQWLGSAGRRRCGGAGLRPRLARWPTNWRSPRRRRRYARRPWRRAGGVAQASSSRRSERAPPAPRRNRRHRPRPRHRDGFWPRRENHSLGRRCRYSPRRSRNRRRARRFPRTGRGLTARISIWADVVRGHRFGVRGVVADGKEPAMHRRVQGL